MMMTSAPNVQFSSSRPIAQALDNIADSLERLVAGVQTLRSHLLPECSPAPVQFDPKDPANKFEVGGLMKLTPRGIEICYRLFDAGMSRYAVAQLMNISFGAASHRLAAWKNLGGPNRVKQPLE
jgi:DNA-binding NarL/FixJ family response regulator